MSAAAAQRGQPPLTASDDGPIGRFGVVLFDQAADGPGWACRAGGEPFRFRHHMDLGTASMWLTNADYDEAGQSGLWQNRWCHTSKWARIDVAAMRDEWGLSGTSPEQAITLLARCFARVMRFSHEALGLDQAEAPLPTARSLQEFLAPLYAAPEMPSSDMAIAATHALQDYTVTGIRKPEGGREIHLREPRLTYARTMIGKSVPLGPWRRLAAEDMPGKAEERTAWLADLAEDKPVIAKIAVLGNSHDLAAILGFGYGSRIPREWACGPELRVLERVAKVRVEAAWIGAGTVPLAPALTADAQSRLGNTISAASWSYGVFAENLWLAATRPAAVPVVSRPVRAGQRAPASGQTKADRVPSVRGVWLRAADRIALFTKAAQLNQKGYAVVAYGAGSIRLSVPPEAIGSLIADGFALGLLPSLSVTGSQEYGRYIAPGVRNPDPKLWGGETIGRLEALIRLKGDRALVAEFDGLPELPSAEEQGAVVRRLLKGG